MRQLRQPREARARGEGRLSKKKGAAPVYGITYRQIEQYIIARYGVCANGRLMGSLAASVRAGRMFREGRTYMPTGSMLSAIVMSELAALSGTQRAAAIAEEKRNRRLAKQMLLSGKARKRQELEDRRLLHNRHVKAAVAFGEARRDCYLQGQLTLLKPFIKGAKRALQVRDRGLLMISARFTDDGGHLLLQESLGVEVDVSGRARRSSTATADGDGEGSGLGRSASGTDLALLDSNGDTFDEELVHRDHDLL